MKKGRWRRKAKKDVSSDDKITSPRFACRYAWSNEEENGRMDAVLRNADMLQVTKKKQGGFGTSEWMRYFGMLAYERSCKSNWNRCLDAILLVHSFLRYLRVRHRRKLGNNFKRQKWGDHMGSHAPSSPYRDERNKNRIEAKSALGVGKLNWICFIHDMMLLW